jgi:hypothetical protein
MLRKNRDKIPTGKVERCERRRSVEIGLDDAKPEGDPSFGISLGDELRLPKRHPACRRREAQPGFCVERENLDGDAKGKGTSGSNRRFAPISGLVSSRQTRPSCADIVAKVFLPW